MPDVLRLMGLPSLRPSARRPEIIVATIPDSDEAGPAAVRPHLDAAILGLTARADLLDLIAKRRPGFELGALPQRKRTLQELIRAGRRRLTGERSRSEGAKLQARKRSLTALRDGLEGG